MLQERGGRELRANCENLQGDAGYRRITVSIVAGFASFGNPGPSQCWQVQTAAPCRERRPGIMSSSRRASPQHRLADGPNFRADRYFRYDDMTSMLRAWADQFPDLCELGSTGKTWEGRDIWAITLTNRATGQHHEKPATFVDANIHAGEVSGSATVLWLIHHLLYSY